MTAVTVGKGRRWEAEIEIGPVTEGMFLRVLGALGYISVRSGANITNVYVTADEFAQLARLFSAAAISVLEVSRAEHDRLIAP